MNRRDFIKGIGIAVAAAKAVPFIPSLITTPYVEEEVIAGDRALSFAEMLEEYLPHNLLKEGLYRNDYLFSAVTQKDMRSNRNNWQGGTLVVPFKGGKNGN